MRYKQALNHKVFSILSFVAKELNVKAYVIGGFVRDALLRLEGADDIDIVVEGSGVKFAKAFAEKVDSKLYVYENYGTAMVPYDGLNIEFVGARKEMYERGSRKPIVEEGTLYDDQLRRDFTINALSLSINESDFGELFDPFNGIWDLKKGIIRTPIDPNITMSEDPLRMLRACRFAAKLSTDEKTFIINADLCNAIRNNLHRMDIISRERITGELEKMFGYYKCKIGLQYMDKLGLYDVIMKNKGQKQDKRQKMFDVMDMIYNINPFHSELRWTVFLYSCFGDFCLAGKEFKLSNERVDFMEKTHMAALLFLSSSDTMFEIKKGIIEAGKYTPEAYTLARAWANVNYQEKPSYFEKQWDALFNVITETIDEFSNFKCPLNGNEICELLNLQPSKEIGIWLQTIKHAIIKGEISNTKTAAKWFLLKNFYKNNNLA